MCCPIWKISSARAKAALTGLGESDAAARGFEQLMAQRLLQLAHLRADGLHGHVQLLGGPGEAAFLGDDPKVVEVAVVQHVSYGS